MTCRRWNWRQGTRTRLADASTRAFFVFDRLPALPLDGLDRAMVELEAGLEERWPGIATRRVVIGG